MRLMQIVMGSIVTALVGGCSEWWENDDDDDVITEPEIPDLPDPPQDALVGGQGIVLPSHSLEQEPNDSIEDARWLATDAVLSGFARGSETGFTLPDFPEVAIQDLFYITAPETLGITLQIGSDDPSVDDLDLFLLDQAGQVLGVSESRIDVEYLETLGAGDFWLGVRAFQGGSHYVLSVTSSGRISSSHYSFLRPGSDFVAGDLIVKPIHEGNPWVTAIESIPVPIELKSTRALSGGAYQVSFSGQEPFEHPGKLNTPESRESRARALTLSVIQRLRTEEGIDYCEPNFVSHLTREPNDTFYDFQWHYSLIHLPQAWETTTGSEDVIAAVIDTGVLVDHPDIRDRLIDGYDFISDAFRANDGDGIDGNPNDPGDDPDGYGDSFHGTHVAGTVGASTDNSLGTSGVTWATQIMPVRVLGVGGGTDADIAEGIRFAAGLPNVSGEVPLVASHIINMSFGSYSSSRLIESAVMEARAQGSILIAAAGNNNRSAPMYPGAYPGVVSVSAVDLASQKAFYSNYGVAVDVAAPGGDTTIDLNGDSYADGVLSLMGDQDGDFYYLYNQGTSMAAPHVAGVCALMKSVHPGLSPDDLDLLLEGTHPRTNRTITTDLGIPGRDDLFGHGLIDASQAVLAAEELADGGSPPSGSRLAVSVDRLDFGSYLERLPFHCTNSGSGPLDISNIYSDAPWITVHPRSGSAPLRCELLVDRTLLLDGSHSTTIYVQSDATIGPPDFRFPVHVDVGPYESGNVGMIFVLAIDVDSFETVAQTTTDFTEDYHFLLPTVPEGTYFIVAGTDRDNDNFICDVAEACGFYSEAIDVSPGVNLAEVNFSVADVVRPQGLGDRLWIGFELLDNSGDE